MIEHCLSLGLCDVRKRFISDIAQTLTPQNHKLQKKHPKEFDALENTNCNSIRPLQSNLISEPVVALHCAEEPYLVETKARNVNVDRIFLQDQPGRTKEPSKYCSRSLRRVQRAYETTRRECSAIVCLDLVLRPLLIRIRITIRTCQGLPRWRLIQTGVPERLARLQHSSLDLDFYVVHKVGVKCQCADAL